MTTPDNVTPISGDAKPAGSDNVFDLDDELSEIVLRGLDRYGIEEGTLAEPTEPQVSRWRREVYRSLQSANRRPQNMPDSPTNAQVIDALAEFDWSAGTRQQVDAFAILCGGSPPVNTKSKKELPRPVAPVPPTPPGDGPGRAPERHDFDDDTSFEAAKQAHDRLTAEHTKAAAEHEKARTAYERKAAEHDTKLDEWEAAWTGGYPSRAQLAALPWRVRAKLFGKLTGWFLDPTGETSVDTTG